MQTVFVGLSGGVDSAVSAYLLKQQGYRVIGAFIKGWEPDFLPCTGTEDRLSAMRVAAHLKIPFVVYDLEKEYKRDVVDYFVAEYEAGRTPNPDVMCNRTIKFGAFWERAKNDGADCIATGHYAVNTRTQNGYALTISADAEKDQTYFLWTLTQTDLNHVVFPVGSLEKREVRRIATDAALPNAGRKDSQGLCFLGHVDMHAFLKRYIPARRGAIVDESGASLGEHDGISFYTIGQHVSVGGMNQRRYVVKKDFQKNRLIVSENPKEEASREHTLLHPSWVSGSPPSGDIQARYRYRQTLIPASIRDGSAIFSEPQPIASGQSVVFYDAQNSRCLGGGVAA